MERNEGKPPICRLSSLSGFGGVIVGRDMGGIFKEGHVYSAVNVLDTIIITDLGEHAVAKWVKGGTISQYATSGTTMLTKEEYERELETKEST